MDAEIRIIETLLAKARELKLSSDPEETIAAAKHEIRLNAELASLRKQQLRKPRTPVPAGG
ncbi:MAG: hypothetical protein QOE26_180 [Verrucomicrobiota bacterium]|jgi:hypothetical protein